MAQDILSRIKSMKLEVTPHKPGISKARGYIPLNPWLQKKRERQYQKPRYLLYLEMFMNEILRSRQSFKHKKISDNLRSNHKLTVDN